MLPLSMSSPTRFIRYGNKFGISYVCIRLWIIFVVLVGQYAIPDVFAYETKFEMMRLYQDLRVYVDYFPCPTRAEVIVQWSFVEGRTRW